MAKKYIMHRVSYESDVSFKLLEHGYLSIGFSDGQDVYEAALTGDWDIYIAACNNEYVDQEWWNSTVKRAQPFRFLNMSIGDIIVVPLWYGLFSIYEVANEPLRISDFDLSLLGKDNKNLYKKDGVLYDGDRQVDLGFLLPVKIVRKHLLRREYADANLTSRMKFPQTNTDIDDIFESVERAINAETPINFYESVIESIPPQLLNTIISDLNPDKFEKLIMWFMKKQGFSTYIAAKNERGKEEYADVDVVANSDLLKLTIHIQGKFHKGITDDWAVEQISRYSDQKRIEDDIEDDYIYISWVITTANEFSAIAKEKAAEKRVRLIDGLMFARMLIDAGVVNINEAFD